MNSKFLKNKFVIALIVLILVIVADFSLPNINLVNRAIVIGMGIDVVEDGQFELSVQYILPKSNASNQTSQSGYAVAQQTAMSVGEFHTKFQNMLGLRLSLAHCSIVVMGEDYAREGNFEILKYFMLNEKFPDTAKMVVTQGKAGDFMKLNIPYSEVVSYQLRSLLGNLKETHGVASIDINKFFQLEKDIMSANYLPYVVIEEYEKDNFQDETSAAGEVTYYTFTLNNTAVFDKEGFKIVLSEKESLGFSYVYKKINSGNILLTSDMGENYVIKILNLKSEREVDKEGFKATVKISADVSMYNAEGKTDGAKILTQSESDRLKGIISESVLSCYLTCKEKDIDIFGFNGIYYRKYYKELGDTKTLNLLSQFDFNVEVDINLIS